MYLDAAAKKVEITVEELCQKTVCHASIDVRGLRIRTDGERIDEQMEAQHGLRYTRKVPFSRTVSRGGLFYTVRGVCDGVLREDGKTTVCVNRYVGGPTERIMTELVSESIGAAVAYAYLAAEAEFLSSVTFRVTFYHTKNDCKIIEKTYPRGEMADAFLRLVDLHRPFAALEAERQLRRIPGAKAAAFPYREMRPQQHDFMLEVLRAVKNHGAAIIEAPTGTGKTAAALFPALKALGAGYVDKIFYFTSKNTTALAALDTLKKLSAASGVRAVQITAKERACPIRTHDPFKCTPEKCPRAAGYYARLTDAISEAVTASAVLDGETVGKYADRFSLCPYEFSLDLSEVCDVVICDCNYLIDDIAYFRRYFGEDANGRYLFLFDEAHNLLERAKASFGAELRLSDVRKFLNTLPEGKGPVIDALCAIERKLSAMRSLCADSMEEDERGEAQGFATDRAFDKEFFDLLSGFEREVGKLLYTPAGLSVSGELLELRSAVKKYLNAYAHFDECFVHTVTVSGDELISKILCLDPSKRLAECLHKGVASVFFSATLAPPAYYASLYGVPDAAVLQLDSPYDRGNLCVCMMDKVSVRYQFRSQNAAAVADIILSTVSRRDGNYMVYFPSYAYMAEVQTLFKYKYPHIRVVMQERGMREEDRRAFLDAFRKGTHRTLVGFCVLGGIYAEGIDLAGDALIGSVIVGVGLVQPNNESEVLREYCDEKYEAGQEYAYIYPGFNRVLQAAGRVIRTENDRGVVVFVDERYAESPYRELMPYQFRKAKLVGDTRALESVLDAFWAEKM